MTKLSAFLQESPLPEIPAGAVSHIVVIAREGTPEVTEFRSYVEAADYFEHASIQWTESYLALVINGPGSPLKRRLDPHCRPDVVKLRTAPNASTCGDIECTLSGGFSHVGPCEPCGCPLRHAIAECLDTEP